MVGIIDTPEKELANFVDLVRRMRLAQSGFFLAKKDSVERKNFYYESRTLERLVDDFVAREISKAEKTGTLL